jgi:tryptophan 2,3-dioxygenase
MTFGKPTADYRLITDADRARTTKMTGGEPVYDLRGESKDVKNTYAEYTGTGPLHSIQRVRSPEPDERTFLITGQVMELLFNLTHSEVQRTQQALRADDLQLANVILARVQRVIELMTQSWDLIGTLTPSGYVGFRDHLGTASGFGSYMYRHVEFVLGNKVRRMLDLHRPNAPVYAALKADFEAPSIYDDAIAVLHRRGYAIDAACLQRDWSEPHQMNQSVYDAWLDIYRSGNVSSDLYRLAEGLTAIASHFKTFRFRHFVSVERLIGSKPGSGGTSGLGWLRHIVDQNFFPELWAVRTVL